jgi:hypothetical protein
MGKFVIILNVERYHPSSQEGIVLQYISLNVLLIAEPLSTQYRCGPFGNTSLCERDRFQFALWLRACTGANADDQLRSRHQLYRNLHSAYPSRVINFGGYAKRIEFCLMDDGNAIS